MFIYGPPGCGKYMFISREASKKSLHLNPYEVSMDGMKFLLESAYPHDTNCIVVHDFNIIPERFTQKAAADLMLLLRKAMSRNIPVCILSQNPPTVRIPHAMIIAKFEI